MEHSGRKYFHKILKIIRLAVVIVLNSYVQNFILTRLFYRAGRLKHNILFPFCFKNTKYLRNNIQFISMAMYFVDSISVKEISDKISVSIHTESISIMQKMNVDNIIESMEYVIEFNQINRSINVCISSLY